MNKKVGQLVPIKIHVETIFLQQFQSFHIHNSMAPKTWTFVYKKNTRNEPTKCSDRSYMSNHWTTLCKGHLVGKQKRGWLSTKVATWDTQL